MSVPGVPKEPTDGSMLALRAWMRQTSTVVNTVLQGKMNNVMVVTLDANADSTTVFDGRFTNESAVDFMPTTANAAAEKGGGTLYVPEAGRVDGQLTIAHSNAPTTDRTFRIRIVG
jgi:hypothetical protein